MLARAIAGALFFVLCAEPAGRAAEPPAPTIVLQLPPSMSPDAVKSLIADLAAKGARPLAQPIDPPEAAAPPAFTTADIAAQVWEGSKQALQTLPILRRAPQIWIKQVEAERGTPGLALWFWMVGLRVSWPRH